MNKLLELVRCGFREGRAKLAHIPRGGQGATKGELLTAGGGAAVPDEGLGHFRPTLHRARWADMADDISWYGRAFPNAFGNNGDTTETPEAYPCIDGTLPRQHAQLALHFLLRLHAMHCATTTPR